MLAIFLETLPFFLLIGCGYGASRAGMFPEAAVGYLTKFVFFFALSAMLFRFAATLPVSEIIDPWFIAAYLGATMVLYLATVLVLRLAKHSLEEIAVEAQCGVIGNVGFLSVPIVIGLFGEAAAGPVLMLLSIDLLIFGSLIVLMITGARGGRISGEMIATMGTGLLKNPMVMSIFAGLLWSLASLPLPGPMLNFLEILGAAATPGALFAIGASLAVRKAERIEIAAGLSVIKLIIHPAICAVAAFLVFPVDPFAAAVMVATAAAPTAGNVFMLAEHYGVAQQRASSTIFVSTVAAVVTMSVVFGLVLP
ncbi:MAG: AEC family transporter [Pseudomonadota bacterium]